MPKHDIQLPPYQIELVALEAGQVIDWGHAYLKPETFYSDTQGEGAVIFIIDTAGTFMDHPDLMGNNLAEYNKNRTNSPDKDGHGHGTHCAGISAAIDNGVGVIGIAPKAGLVALKGLNDSGGGSFDWVAELIKYAADLPNDGRLKDKKRIISMSLGGPAGQPGPRVLTEAIDYAIEKGCFVVAAAGNSGFSGTGSTVGAPANHPPVIAVASTDRPGDRRSSFSSGGNEVDLAAPGGSIYSTHRNGQYARLSGTSMACPQVAGVMALILSANPEISSQAALTEFLATYATDILQQGKDPGSGYGTPILSGYVDKEPGEGEPAPDPDPTPDPDPAPDPAPEPEPIPRRPDGVATTHFPADSGAYSLIWRPADVSGMRNLLVTGLSVKVTSDVRTPELAAIVRGYLAGWFKSRGMVIKAGQDLRDALVWCAAFLQFNADDDKVFEEYGVRLDLIVTGIETMTEDRVKISVSDTEIAARVKELEHERAAGVAVVNV